MLDFYFDSKVRMRQLRLGPLTEHLDGLAGELQRQSFSRNRARGNHIYGQGLVGRDILTGHYDPNRFQASLHGPLFPGYVVSHHEHCRGSQGQR